MSKVLKYILIGCGILFLAAIFIIFFRKNESDEVKTDENIEYLAKVIMDMQDKIDELAFYNDVHERMRLDGLPLAPKKPVVKCYQILEEDPKPNVTDSGRAHMDGSYEEYISQFELK